MVDSGGLENRCTREGTGGSNPSASVLKPVSVDAGFFCITEFKGCVPPSWMLAITGEWRTDYGLSPDTGVCAFPDKQPGSTVKQPNSNSGAFMDTNINDMIDTLHAYSSSTSLEKRREAFELFLKADGDAQKQLVWDLLDAPYRDIREAVIEFCSPERINDEAWKSCLLNKISSADDNLSANIRQALLIFIQRLDGALDDAFVQFNAKALDDADNDVRYQAFVLAELQKDSSESYLMHLEKWIDSNDADFRIVAIQALARLNPPWAFEKLSKKYKQTSGEEAFHILLTLLKICPDSARIPEFAHQLADYAIDDRFAFPAIQALSHYGTDEEIPKLLEIAKSLLAEPTIRVAAAGAAAALGSDDGKALLQKFSKSRHGNPKYAEELLEELAHKSQPAH